MDDLTATLALAQAEVASARAALEASDDAETSLRFTLAVRAERTAMRALSARQLGQDVRFNW